MITVYFNEQGFLIEGKLGEVKELHDAPAGVLTDATALYSFRWYVFNSAMDQLREFGNVNNEELYLYTDSRLVEELNGEIKTDNDFANKSRLYYFQYDFPRFKKVRVEKCPTTTINRKLHESLSSERDRRAATNG